MEAQAGVLDTGELWRLTMEHSPVGMALVAPDGEILAANAALGEMLAYDPDLLVSRSVADLTHPDDLATDLDLMRRAMAGAMASYRVPKRCFRSDGSLLRGELSALLLRSPEGDPLHFIMQIVDRTDVHAFAERLDVAEQAAFDMQRKSRAILETVSVGLLLVDADGTYSSWNRRQQELLDIAFPEGHGGRAGQSGFVYDAEQQHELSFEQFPCARATEGAGEEFDDLLIWIGEDPAARRALSVSARTVHDRTGSLAGAVLAYNDVTELISARRVKDDFVSTVSHELRTPLAAALANLELLDVSAAGSDEAQLQVAAARRNMLRLSHLVADLLFTATTTSGMKVIDPFRVDLAMVVAEAVQAAGLQADASGIDLVVDLPDELEVLADGLRLRQVADNLIANALTFTPAGGRVSIALSATGRQAWLEVADSGEGMEADDLAEVFAPFVRGQNARRRLSPGTGLGLTIVRTIVEAHGGEVSARSIPGEGTTVRVVLPR
ncbi:PAS domain-containing sensor histidine kinase [Nocardioides alpinus]|uniref:PAS domain-containing sensor histidine kinase n=1 Tax=Nocardioides alpinus TaxID=748909 RepID=UPI001114587F|nr:HAMP domain-containing sensor histidine kinase [Nocardioides alpinus]